MSSTIMYSDEDLQNIILEIKKQRRNERMRMKRAMETPEEMLARRSKRNAYDRKRRQMKKAKSINVDSKAEAIDLASEPINERLEKPFKAHVTLHGIIHTLNFKPWVCNIIKKINNGGE